MKKLGNIVLTIIIIFGIGVIFLNLIGFKTARISSDSMAPVFYKNSLAIIKVIDEDYLLEDGDIIVFNDADGSLFSHEIIKIEGNQITTKGRANNKHDPNPVNRNDVSGIYLFSIPIIGILFASIYPWLIIILIVLTYQIIIQIKKEIKKD